MQSSEPHVAQKFVAIPPDLDSLLQWELLNSQIQSALLFFATSIYALVIAAMHRVYFAALFRTRLDAIAGPA